MTTTTDHRLLYADELLTALANTQQCQDCTGGLGVCVEPNGDWEIVQLHAIPCVNGRKGK
jgi:hypothetical protein